MSQFSYNLPLCRTSSKPIEIYGKSGKVGVVKGFYGSVFTKFLDKISSECGRYLTYELRDSENNVRIISKDARGFTRKKAFVTYIDHDKVEHEIVMRETKCFDIDETITFIYKNKEYLINKKLFEPAQLVVDGNIIADCKVQFTDRAYNVKMNIYNYAYLQEHYLVLGLFHAALS